MIIIVANITEEGIAVFEIVRDDVMNWRGFRHHWSFEANLMVTNFRRNRPAVWSSAFCLSFYREQPVDRKWKGGLRRNAAHVVLP